VAAVSLVAEVDDAAGGVVDTSEVALDVAVFAGAGGAAVGAALFAGGVVTELVGEDPGAEDPLNEDLLVDADLVADLLATSGGGSPAPVSSSEVTPFKRSRITLSGRK